MSRILSEFNRSVFLMRHQMNNKITYESVRYNLKRKRKEPFRKPIWQPMAPSKLFRIRQKEVLTEDELEQREHFTNTFENNMRSIKQYFRDEFYLPTVEAGGMTHEQVLEEEREQLQLIQENNRENQRVAKMREERVALQSQLIDQQLIVSHLQQIEDSKLKGEQLDQVVRQEIERSKSYITHATLELAIEDALANPVSYDFAVDVEGNVHYSGSLHPYAFKPSAVPETSSNTEEFANTQNVRIKLEPKHLY